MGKDSRIIGGLSLGGDLEKRPRSSEFSLWACRARCPVGVSYLLKVYSCEVFSQGDRLTAYRNRLLVWKKAFKFSKKLGSLMLLKIQSFLYFRQNMNQIRSEQIKQEKVGLVEKLQRRLSLPHKQSGSRRLSRSQSGYR